MIPHSDEALLGLLVGLAIALIVVAACNLHYK
jgi:hypothetical protein